MALSVLAMLVVALVAGVARVISVARGPVSRARLERFARRQQLLITTGNGNAVIGYLATTRRWRSAGLALGLTVSLVLSLPHGAVTINFFTLFAGWFAGAVAAEWQVNSEGSSGRAALLVPRRREDYLPGPARWLTDGATVAVIASGLFAVVRSAAAGFDIVAVVLLCAVAAVVLTIGLVQRRVLTRRQPVAAADVLAADDAIRARSLQVLTGSTLALLGYLGAGFVVQAGRPGHTSGVSFVLMTLAPFVGWLIATGRSPVRRALADHRGSAVGAQP